MPGWFDKLLTDDAEVRELWHGARKPEHTDHSASGFDYSLVKRLMFLGYRNIDDLSAILALRPEGSVLKHHKTMPYIRRTIANALIR